MVSFIDIIIIANTVTIVENYLVSINSNTKTTIDYNIANY